MGFVQVSEKMIQHNLAPVCLSLKAREAVTEWLRSSLTFAAWSELNPTFGSRKIAFLILHGPIVPHDLRVNIIVYYYAVLGMSLCLYLSLNCFYWGKISPTLINKPSWANAKVKLHSQVHLGSKKFLGPKKC